MAGLISQIKNEVKKSGANKKKFVYVREGEKRRFRFLTDADDGAEFTFHDDFSGGVTPTPCQEIFGRSCPYCGRDGIRTRNQYAWSVWDYEDSEVKVFMYPVNNCSPVPQLVNFYETYGTLCDRDYVISVSGRQQNKTFGVVPMDKVKFRNVSAKPFSQGQLLKMLDKAFPCNPDDDSDGGDDDFPMPKPEKDIDSGWDDEDLPSAAELEAMKPQKLYNLCKERDIEAKPRQDAEYYIDKLETWRKDHTDIDNDYDEDQGWGDEPEEEKPDYDSMSPQELYKLCKGKSLDVQPKKPAKYYINQLQELDSAKDDWEDDDEDYGGLPFN